MSEVTIKLPSWRKTIIYALSVIGGIFVLAFISGALYSVVTPADSSNSVDREFAKNIDFGESYSNGDIEIFYSQNKYQDDASELGNFFREYNTTEASAYIWEGSNNRVNLALTTIYDTSAEIPQQTSSSNQRTANLVSREIFENSTVVVKLLDTSGKKTLKTYISN